MKTPSFARAKRVNSPLHEHVKARIIGLSSSGSEHSPDDVTSLSALLHDFLHQNDFIPELVSSTDHHPTDEIKFKFKLEQNNPTVVNQEDDDVIRSKLLLEVSNAVEIFSWLKQNKASLRRNVMATLRDLGYNAGICKTKWQSFGGVTAGSYEFIDVVVSDSGEFETRYFIDLDFSGEFEIAKQSDEYERLLRSLPSIFVGKKEELTKIVKFMSDAVKRSLKDNGLHLPPWRNNRYMMNKWFGSYRRTTTLEPGNTLTASLSSVTAVKCRLSGFDAVKIGSFIPAATRTR